tara:strand:- start:12469 stop:12672 length:204 start_codon:yes stop_codon:yes gene_type:complete
VNELIAKIAEVLAQFGTSLMAYLWARDRARAAATDALREKEHAIRQAGDLGPRTQSDAIERLHEGRF